MAKCQCSPYRRRFTIGVSLSRNVSNAGFIEHVSIRTAEGAVVDIPAALVLDCTYAKNQLSLDRLKTAYDQKLRYSMLHIPPELGRKPPDSLRRTASVGVIYCLIADPEKENRGVDSQRIGGDFMQICFSISSGDVTELPKSLGEAKSWTRSLIIKALIPEGFFAMLDMLEEVQDSKTCSQRRRRGFNTRRVSIHCRIRLLLGTVS